MTLDQLRALCAVVEHGGFHAAADALYRSQSAISVAIRNLEQELKLQLFDRSGYRPVLTQHGQLLYSKAKRLLDHCEEFNATAARFAKGEETEVSIALSAISPVEQILEVIKQLSRSAPATRMRLQIENMGGTIERLLEREVDFAIAERFIPYDQLDEIHLTSTEMVSVIAPTFPLADRFPDINISDLGQHVQVVVRDTSKQQPRQSIGVLAGAPQWLVNDFDMKKRMILTGSAWGRMPRHRIAEELADGRLLELSGQGLYPRHIDLYLFRRSNEPKGPVGEQLWRMMQQCNFQEGTGR